MIVTSLHHLEVVLKNLRGQFEHLQTLRVVGPWHAWAKGTLLADLKEQIEFVENKLSAMTEIAREKSA